LRSELNILDSHNLAWSFAHKFDCCLDRKQRVLFSFLCVCLTKIWIFT
jgi:hypothetical protein